MSSMPMSSSPMPVSLGAAEGMEIEVPPPSLNVSVGGFAWAIGALAFGGLATFLYYSSPSSRGDGVLVWGGLGVLCAAGAIVAFVRRARLRFRARMFQYGFTIGNEAFRFDELEAVALDEKPRLANGRPIGFDRRIVVRASGRRADVRHFVARIDPLGAFTNTMLDRAAEAAERRLPRGVLGAGWRLDNTGLQAGNTGVTRFEEVTKAGVFDGQIRLWRRREELPFLSVATGSDNAFTLLRLLETRMKAQEAAAPAGPEVMRAPSAPGEPVQRPAATAGTVGRLLFERRPQRLLGVLTGLYALFTPAIPFLWMDAAKNEEDLLAAISATLLGPFCLFATIYIFTAVVRFHEHAVVKKSLFGTKTHAYASVERMKWAETRNYYNGSYVGTTHAVKLHSTGQKRPLKFSVQRKGSDEDLGYVRDTISRFISQLMERQIEAYGRVPWGQLVLTKEAVEIPRGKQVERILYTMPVQATMDKGTLHFRRPNEKKVLASVAAAAENFFPGLIVVQKRATLVG
jgi:hypothetical protein